MVYQDSEPLDAKCQILIGHIMRTHDQWLSFRRLAKICGSEAAKNDRMDMSPRIVGVHLKHLRKQGMIEYEKKRVRRGSKKRFRISLHKAEERTKLELCRRIHNLIQDVLLYLGDSVDQQLNRYDISSDPALKGRLLLQYRSRPHIVRNDLPFGTQEKLLEVNWQYFKHRNASFDIQIHVGRPMPPRVNASTNTTDEFHAPGPQ